MRSGAVVVVVVCVWGGGGTTNIFYCCEHATYFKVMLSLYNDINLSETVAFEPHPKLNQNAMTRP